MAEKLPREIPVSKKHFSLRVIAFVVALAVGLTAIGFGVYALVHKDPGIYTLVAYADKEVPYSGGVTAQFYFSGDDISGKVRNATDYLSRELRQSYMRCDEYKVYSECSSIGAVNSALGEDVKVDGTVYSILQDAYAKTLEKKNFSLFAGPLYEEWERCLAYSQAEAIDADPIFDQGNREYLEKATAMVNDLSNFSLTFKDDNTIRLDISEAYAKFRSDYEVTSPVLTLNVLQTAYKTQAVVDAFAESGAYHGVIYDNQGSYAFLDPATESELAILDAAKYSNIHCATLKASRPCAVSLIHHFPISSDQYNPGYRFEHEGKLLLRSVHLNLSDGMPSNAFAASAICLPDSRSIVEARYQNNALGAYADLDSARQASSPNTAFVSLTSQQIYAGKDIAPSLVKNSEAYTINEI